MVQFDDLLAWKLPGSPLKIVRAGSTEQSTTLIRFADAISAIAARLFSVSSSVMGPVLPAMSLTPPRITTAARLQVHHVLVKTENHLRRSLPTDATIDVGLAGEGLIKGASPQ